jgi:hypothetical protein
VNESLNQRLESEAAKLLEKAHLNRATGSGGGGNTERGSSAGRCSRCVRVRMEGDGPYGVAGRQPFRRQTALRADRWRDMGAMEYKVRAIRFGIVDLPSIPFTSGVVLPVIPQSREDLEFGRCDLGAGCASGI